MRGYLQVFTAALFLLSTGLSNAQSPSPNTGKIIRLPEIKSRFVEQRNVDVWLPPGFQPQQKHAVLYMHDGQMLFDSASTWNKQEWGVDEVMSRLLADRLIEPCIVVAVWNTANRHGNYFPQKPFETLSASQKELLLSSHRTSGQQVFSAKINSDNYLRFLVEELKPEIDKLFPTKTGKENTFIAGSSMGGLISLYAICEYPEVFGGAACLSTHWPGIFRSENNPFPDAFFHYLENKLPDPSSHKLYFDHGSETLDAMYKPYQLRADSIILRRGYQPKNWITREFAGEDHSEKAWNRRLDIPIKFLLGKNSSKG